MLREDFLRSVFLVSVFFFGEYEPKALMFLFVKISFLLARRRSPGTTGSAGRRPARIGSLQSSHESFGTEEKLAQRKIKARERAQSAIVPRQARLHTDHVAYATKTSSPKQKLLHIHILFRKFPEMHPM